MRRSYKAVWNVLLEENLPTRNPVDLFDRWFTEAKDSNTIYETNAVAVASATRDGIPSVRMVLLKQFDERGFVFFTNYDSRKGRELLSNPRAAMLFYWDQQHRQVRVEGRVEKICRQESEAYFETRPRDSQISASISKQSTVVESRKVLEEEHEALKIKYCDTSTPVRCPDNWGGLILIPECFEFWQDTLTCTIKSHQSLQRTKAVCCEHGGEFFKGHTHTQICNLFDLNPSKRCEILWMILFVRKQL
ncbi:uncharacterized protein LOC111255580 isoform X3 [Varroa destructor]|nr:uncharacterized protein LOC111255580 isoform X3 [Varroa destructor]XP_022673429.1 uncharacterized protein LOC111255580 isoform X3 [Varroa destructor]XP_022673430.1 uncharacterized protein LOC111255580 isoform X3 [Varroa destructor]